MDLNLPIFDQVAHCNNLLIAGMGGGYDVFCGLPMFLELQRRGQTLHRLTLAVPMLSISQAAFD